MFNYSKDGVVVSTVLGARTINKEGNILLKSRVIIRRGQNMIPLAFV